MIHTRIRKAFDWLLLLPALLPLLYIDTLLYPYLTPKTLLLRAFGIIAVSLFVYLILAGEAFYWRRLQSPITWVPAGLLLVAYGTSIIGIDFYRSFWSIFGRGDGLLTLSIIVAFFYLILLATDNRFFLRLCKVVAWVGGLVAIHALLQWLELISGVNIPFIAQSQGRLGGTLGNAAFLASYLGLSLFATLIATRDYGLRGKRVLYAAAVLQVGVIMLTGTRGSFVALAAALCGVCLYYAWRGEGKIRDYSRGAMVAGIVVIGIFFIFRPQLMHAPFEPLQRLASISLTDATVSSRLFLWQHIGEQALQTPLTGVGAEHIDALFDRVYDPSAINEQWFDRSHNSFLDYFVQFGVLGLGLYLALIVLCGYTGWQLFKAGDKNGLYLLLFTLVYAVQNFFVFDTAMTLWLLFVFFAAALVLKHDTSAKAAPMLTVPMGPWAGALLAIAMLFLLIPVFIQPLRANLDLADAYQYHVVDVTRSVDSLKQGFALNTYANLEYGYEVYQMYTGEQLTMVTGADLVAAYNEAKQILQTNFDRYPYDARTATYLAHVLDSTPPGVAADNELLGKALARAMLLSPKRAQPWYIKANGPIHQGDIAQSDAVKKQDYNAAIDILKQYVALVPALAEPRYIIASLYLTLGDKASAKEWADAALPLYTFDPESASRAVRYYIAVEDWKSATRFLEDIIADNPKDYDSTYDLAKTSFLSGNVERAKELVAQLRKEKPGLVETDQAFLKALGQ